MSQKIKTSVEIDGSLTASQIANATTDTDKFLVSDGGTIKYRTGAELAQDLGISAGTTSKVQHQVKAGVAINKGQAVYVTGANGTNIIVGLASNASEATSSKTMGLLNATVAANGFADVIAEGLLDGLNTTAATIGDPIWLGTGGNLIYGLANKPYAPNHLVFIGIVTRVHANQGEIFVKVQNGFELDEIHDVDLKTTAKINGHLLGYNGSLWVNKTIAEWLGYTPYNASNPAGYISSYTETDTLASVTGRGNTANTSIAVRNSISINKSDGSSGGQLSYDSSINQLYLWNSLSSGYFSIYTNNSERFKITSGGSAISIVEHQSPIYYDYNDTSYYVNPNGDSRLSRTYIGNYTNWMTLGAWDGVNNRIEAIGQPLFLTSYGGSIKFGYQGSAQMELSTAGNLTVSGTLSASGYNKTNWDTAYGWGNHASAGYVPTSRIITINGTSYDLSANRNWTITGTETDTLATVTARGATTSTLSSFSGGLTAPTFYDSNNPGYYLDLDGGSRMYHIDADHFYCYSYIYAEGYVSSNDNMRAPIFYDADNTGFYLNPASTSNLNGLSLASASTFLGGLSIVRNGGASDPYGVLAVSCPSSDNYSYISMTRNGVQATAMGIDTSNLFWIGGSGGGGFNAVRSGTYMTVSTGGVVTALGDSRAPIFYDSNNTGYYLDPASTSSIVGLQVYGTLNVSGSTQFYSGATIAGTLSLGNSTNTKIKWGGNTTPTLGYPFSGSSNALWLEVNEGDTGGIAIDNEGVTVYGAGDTGYVFRVIDEDAYQSISNITNATTFQVNQGQNGGGYMRGILNVTDYLTAGSSSRAPIFYDSNDTSRYLDPASSSVLQTLRTYGQLTISTNTSTGLEILSPTGTQGLWVRTGWNANGTATPVSAPTNVQFQSSGSSGGTFTFCTGNDVQLTINGSGITSAGDVTAYSDKRVKENIITIDNALNKVLSLRGVTYNRIDSEDKSQKIGVIAQEIKEVLPQVVQEQEDGMLAVSYGNITAVLIEAIKEQQTQIEELKQLVNQLIKK